MTSKETLRHLIETIQNVKGMTQEEVSVEAGYQPKSLTQALSKKTGHDAVIKKLSLVFKEELKNPTKLQPFEKKEPAKPIDYREEYFALLRKENERLAAQVDTSLKDIEKRALINQAVLESLYLALVKDSERDKSLVETLRKSLKKGSEIS